MLTNHADLRRHAGADGLLRQSTQSANGGEGRNTERQLHTFAIQVTGASGIPAVPGITLVLLTQPATPCLAESPALRFLLRLIPEASRTNQAVRVGLCSNQAGCQRQAVCHRLLGARPLRALHLLRRNRSGGDTRGDHHLARPRLPVWRQASPCVSREPETQLRVHLASRCISVLRSDFTERIWICTADLWWLLLLSCL